MRSVQVSVNTSEKVKAKEIREVEVMLDPSEIDRLITDGKRDFKQLIQGLKHTFLARADLPNDAYLDTDTGNWKQDVEQHGSHSWTETNTLRPAEHHEKMFMDSLNDLSTTLTMMKLS